MRSGAHRRNGERRPEHDRHASPLNRFSSDRTRPAIEGQDDRAIKDIAASRRALIIAAVMLATGAPARTQQVGAQPMASDPRSSSRRRRCSRTGPISAALRRSTRFGRRSASGRSSASSGPSLRPIAVASHLAGFHRARGSRERQTVGRSAAACLAARRAGAGRGGPGRPAGGSGAPLRAGSTSRDAGALISTPHIGRGRFRQRARPGTSWTSLARQGDRRRALECPTPT